MTGLGRGQGCALVASMLRRGIAGNRLFAWRRFSSTGGAGVMSIGSDRRRVGLGGFPPFVGRFGPRACAAAGSGRTGGRA